jgi:alpha-ketoglutarate-dependent taurine dioxygenase
MKPIKIIEFKSLDDIKNNVEEYANALISNSVICFRNANLSTEEQSLVREILGDYFSWYPNSNSKEISQSDISEKYEENHERLKTIEDKLENDKVVLGWHIEHVDHNNPIIASFWNMYKFSANPESGKTLFVNTMDIYNELPEISKEFLLKSEYTSNKYDKPFTKPAIAKHWWTSDPVIRIDITHFGSEKDFLSKFDNRIPTEDEIDTFTEIRNYFINRIIQNNEDLVYAHKWQEGDLVVSDLFVLAHSVTGGFKSEDRAFTGLWARQFPIKEEL